MTLSISGVMDFPALGDDVAVISLRNPGDAVPEPLSGHSGPCLSLVFHDTDGDVLDEPPQPWHLTQVERFLVEAGEGRAVHVHCFAGISRSPALASFVLALRHPAWRDAAVVAAVLRVRPQAQPNATVLALADDHLGRRLRGAWRRAAARY